MFGVASLITDEYLQAMDKRDKAAENPELILSSKEWANSIEANSLMKKCTVQFGVIEPTISDELYDELDQKWIDALYEAISGGITSNTDLVEFFRGTDS